MPRTMLKTMLLLAAVPALLAISAASALADDKVFDLDDWKVTGTLGYGYSDGNYGTPLNTDIQLGLSTLSLANENFKFSVSIPYMRISGRGLVVFDASGNPIVINRRTTLPPDVRTGWGDLNFSASYIISPAILDDFEVRVTAVANAPTASARRRLSTGEADFGVNVDVSHQFGIWDPFVTVGFLAPGQPSGFTINNTTSVSVGTSVELSDSLAAVASYNYDSGDSPLVAASQGLIGSLSWVRSDSTTLTGYGTVGLSSGSPAVGAGFLVSYAFN
jgi:opacity protein-like surface antigen